MAQIYMILVIFSAACNIGDGSTTVPTENNKIYKEFVWCQLYMYEENILNTSIIDYPYIAKKTLSENYWEKNPKMVRSLLRCWRFGKILKCYASAK